MKNRQDAASLQYFILHLFLLFVRVIVACIFFRIIYMEIGSLYENIVTYSDLLFNEENVVSTDL